MLEEALAFGTFPCLDLRKQIGQARPKRVASMKYTGGGT